jgi:hypothetical protein
MFCYENTMLCFWEERNCCPVAYLLSPSTFAITATHILLLAAPPPTHTHTHIHIHLCHMIADQRYSGFEAVHFADRIMVQQNFA